MKLMLMNIIHFLELNGSFKRFRSFNKVLKFEWLAM